MYRVENIVRKGEIACYKQFNASLGSTNSWKPHSIVDPLNPLCQTTEQIMMWNGPLTSRKCKDS